MTDEKVVQFRKPVPQPVQHGADDWETPADMLRDLLGEIERGEVKPTAMFLLYEERHPDNPKLACHPFSTMGFTSLKLSGILNYYSVAMAVSDE